MRKFGWNLNIRPGFGRVLRIRREFGREDSDGIYMNIFRKFRLFMVSPIHNPDHLLEFDSMETVP